MSVLTAPEVAAQLRCNPETIRRLANRGDIRGSFAVGRWVFRQEDIDAYLDETANRTPIRRRRRRAA